MEKQEGSSHLSILAFLDGLFHGLQRVTGELGRDDELAVDILDLLHHVRLQLGKGGVQPVDALQRRLGRLGSGMGRSALAAKWLEDGVQVVDRGQLVVEDVGPCIAPLLCTGLDLLQHGLGVGKVLEHGIDVGLVGRPWQEPPRDPLHALHVARGVRWRGE